MPLVGWNVILSITVIPLVTWCYCFLSVLAIKKEKKIFVHETRRSNDLWCIYYLFFHYLILILTGIYKAASILHYVILVFTIKPYMYMNMDSGQYSKPGLLKNTHKCKWPVMIIFKTLNLLNISLHVRLLFFNIPLVPSQYVHGYLNYSPMPCELKHNCIRFGCSVLNLPRPACSVTVTAIYLDKEIVHRSPYNRK